MESKDFTLAAGDVSLHARLGFPQSGQEKCPLVIIVHGYTGNMRCSASEAYPWPFPPNFPVRKSG